MCSISIFLCVLQQSLFGNKTTGFGTTTTSAPSFGTGTGLFGNKPALTLGTGTNTSSFGMSACAHVERIENPKDNTIRLIHI